MSEQALHSHLNRPENDEWENERDYKIALQNNFWNEALTDLINDSNEYGE